MSAALVFLLQAVVVVALPYFLWANRIVRPLLPLVAVQILVGVALGPTGLGRVLPEAHALLLPPASLKALDGLAWLAVTFFAFQVGLHFDLAELRGRGRRFVAAAVGSVGLPTLAGGLAGWWLLDLVPSAAGAAGKPLVFAVGMGVAAGVTALPVLGAILREMHLAKAPTGVLALGLAAANDAALWVLVAALLALARGGEAASALMVLALAAAYGLVLWLGVKPLLRRLFVHAARARRVNERDVVVIATLVLTSALIAEAIGIHYVVGAFALGVVMPKVVARAVLDAFEWVVTVILLPFFFIVTGLRTSFSLDGGDLAIFAVMTTVAVGGKLVGTALPLGFGTGRWREPLLVGAFMQCKGLMEIVVLTMLLEAEVISASCFSAMVLMALATTAATKPLAAAVLGLRR